MLSNQSYIELYVNNELIELESQESLNLRINNVLFNPTKTTTQQSEYSYSFDIPSTPHNNKVLDYANNLSKLNKFRARYACQVYADSVLIFNGSLTIQKYKGGKYTCNLVNIKVNTLDELFGEEKLTDLKWMIDFDGAPTINATNENTSTKYFFPLVSYGVFQKDYVSADSVGATYTPKKQIDKYNKWWVESFYPSLNMLEVMKKAFESKGYNVIGSAFSDPYIYNIFSSCNLADEQAPNFNLGNEKFGKVTLSATWNNHASEGERASASTYTTARTDISYANKSGGLGQDLKFPYEKVTPSPSSNKSEQWNFSTVQWWNMLDSTNNSAVTVNVLQDTYMYEPNEHLIVIPQDGWYRIDLSINARLKNPPSSGVTVRQWTQGADGADDLDERDIVLPSSASTMKEYLPLEVQLIRNYDNNIELIKGKKNHIYHSGNPNDATYYYPSGFYVNNREEWMTEFPHEDLYANASPTKENGLLESVVMTDDMLAAYRSINPRRTVNDVVAWGVTSSEMFMSFYAGAAQGSTRYNNRGFMHEKGYVMPYDQAVSSSFICGFSSMGEGQMAVMKDGRSWTNLTTVTNQAFCNVKGLTLYNLVWNPNIFPYGGYETQEIETNYCKNEYKQAPSNYVNVTNSSMVGELHCCVWLNRNDILELVAVQRDFDGQAYATSATTNLTIQAITDRNQVTLRGDNFNYNSPCEFPTQLNLFNFTNKETKVTEWLENVKKAFNLDIVQNGNTVEVNTNRGIRKTIDYAVNLDDRVNGEEIESEFISYPKSMAVKYKINTDEYGYELTIPSNHINDSDWAEWGDKGYTVIELNDDSYETSKSETQVAFSYTYYMDFDFYQCDSARTQSVESKGISIPVIEKSEYMAEGYGYDEAMQHDGYSFTQRFWYRQPISEDYIWLSTVLSDGTREKIFLTYPKNSYSDFNLSYKDTEKSIATEYMNIHPMLSSNYIKFGTYLTPQEYMDIKNGALVHVDSDLYYVSELSGFDPSRKNKTTLKLIKKS